MEDKNVLKEEDVEKVAGAGSRAYKYICPNKHITVKYDDSYFFQQWITCPTCSEQAYQTE